MRSYLSEKAMPVAKNRFFRTVAAAFTAAALGLPLARADTFTFDPARTQIRFTLPAFLHTVHGSFKLSSGSVRFDPSTGSAGGTIVVDSSSGASGNQDRDRDMRTKVLESDRFPQITFTPTRIAGRIPSTGRSEVQVQGIFSLHGAGHELAVRAAVTVAGDEVTADARFVVPYVDWGLKNPSTHLLRVGAKVTVDVHAVGILSSEPERNQGAPAQSSRFEKPQPEVLRPGPPAVPHLEMCAFGDLSHFFFAKAHSVPCIAVPFLGRTALYLELEQRAGTQYAVHFPDVILDHCLARDVLKHNIGKREIELARGEHRQIGAVIPVHGGVCKIAQGFTGPCNHLSADVHAVDAAEHAGERPQETPGAAADFEDPHFGRLAALADIHEVKQNVLPHVPFAGSEELVVRPIFLPRSHVIAGVFARAGVPIPLHSFQQFRRPFYFQ